MRREEHASLLITPSVAGRVLRDGRWELSRKFVVGAAAFAERWPGRVKVLMLPRDASDENLDNEVYSPGSLPFDLELGDYTPARLLREDARSSIVLGAIDYRQLDMLRHAAAAGVRVVAITEYSLKTRLQILWSEVAGTLRFARRALWQWNHERHCRAVLRMCRGVQCNGMPTFQRYRSIYPHAMLFYDNRMDVASIPSPARLQRRIESLMLGGPLRLAFSGRLARMKGVQHLPRLVWKLRKAGVDCRFDVFGDGPERNALAAEIGRLGLADVMTLHGAVSYQNRLVPHLTDHVDLFVCCHSQGDPSCTYMETLGCGVPVVGFANEAWRGMQRDLQVGWMVPSGDVAQLAEAIAKLNQHREQIAAGAQDARMTAARHAFQQTMDRRVEHLLQCLENAPTPRPKTPQREDPPRMSQDRVSETPQTTGPGCGRIALSGIPAEPSIAPWKAGMGNAEGHANPAGKGASCLQDAREEHGMIVSAGHPDLEQWRRALAEPLAAVLGLAAGEFQVCLLCPPKPVADDPMKLLICDAKGRRIAVALCSSPTAPDMVGRRAIRAQAAKQALGPRLGDVILDPILEGKALGLGYKVLPYCPPVRTGGLAGRLNRLLLAPRLVAWLRGVVQATVALPPRANELDAEFLGALEHMAGLSQVSAGVRAAAERGAEDLRRRAWIPRRVLMHGDLWLGNVLVRPRRPDDAPRWLPWWERLVVIDWPGSRVDGFPFFDLVRLAQSVRLSRRRLSDEVAFHCSVLGCRRCDAVSYVAAALGDLSLHLESFSLDRFVVLADTCVELMNRVQ